MALYSSEQEKRLLDIVGQVHIALPQETHLDYLYETITFGKEHSNPEFRKVMMEQEKYLLGRFNNHALLHFPTNVLFLSECLLAGERRGFSFIRLAETDRHYQLSRDRIVENYLKEEGFALKSARDAIRSVGEEEIARSCEQPQIHRFFPTYSCVNNAPNKRRDFILVGMKKPFPNQLQYDNLIVAGPNSQTRFDTSICYVPYDLQVEKTEDLESQLFD